MKLSFCVLTHRDKDGGPQGGDSTDEEEVEVEDDALTDEERRFLEQFHSWRKNENKRLRTLYAIADNIDKSHQKATKTKVMTNSASIISGAMCLLGLVLAPVTAGGSLVLTAAGTGLGAAAGISNIVTDVKEDSRNKSALAQANGIIPSSDQELEEVTGKKTAYATAAGEIVYKCTSAWETIRKHIRALQLTKTHPHVASAASKLMTAGRVSTRSSRQIQKAFGGTALAMTKDALMRNSLPAIFFLGQDLYALLKDWEKLQAGKPTELAKELRLRAQKQEQVVSERTCRYERLKKVRAGFWKGPGGRNWHLWGQFRTAVVKETFVYVHVCVWCVRVYVCTCCVDKFSGISLTTWHTVAPEVFSS